MEAIQGAIIGDIAGSVFEGVKMPTEIDWKRIKISATPRVQQNESEEAPIDESWTFENFPLLGVPGQRATDDTILTFAVMSWIMSGAAVRYRNGEISLAYALRLFYTLYPNAGFGPMFKKWALDISGNASRREKSWGNGSCMRVSPVTTYRRDAAMDDVLYTAEMSSKPTHNTLEGVQGACAIAQITHIAREIKDKSEIMQIIRDSISFKENDYPLAKPSEEYREAYARKFTAAAHETAPAAIRVFFEAESFEETIRLAISLGGDTDTLAAMAGTIAGAFYGVPEELWEEAKKKLDPTLNLLYDNFGKTILEWERERDEF